MFLSNPIEVVQMRAMIFVEDKLGTRIDLLLAETLYDDAAIQRGLEYEITPGVSIKICAPEDLIIYKLVSTRLRDHEDAASVIQRQGEALDDHYVNSWLEQFEKALDDSTLVAEYKRLKVQNQKP